MASPKKKVPAKAKSTPAKKAVASKSSAAAPRAPAKKAKPLAKETPVKKAKAKAAPEAEKKVVPAPKTATKKVVAPKSEKPAAKKEKASKKAKATAAPKNELADIMVRRDAETIQTKVTTRRRGLIVCTPKELELIFLRRGTNNMNLFDPANADNKPTPLVKKQILTELPKAKPRKIGAVSLDDLFGYNPFAKDSVSAEEKLIPSKWMKYYKKLVSLKAGIQKEIDEQSQTAFSRSGKEDFGEISASYSQHTADIDNEAFTRDCALSLLASKQQELAEINIAIERMKKGTYGICEITGKPIPAERLRDVPFTRYSIEGKLEAEKQRQVEARRRRAAAATDIASVTDLENDVPIVFGEDDDADNKKAATPTPEDEEK